MKDTSSLAVELRATNRAEAPRQRAPVTLGVPFPEGHLRSLAHVALFDDAGKEVPCQVRPMSAWQDGSVKWMLLDYQVDIGPTQHKSYQLRYGPEVRRATPANGISIEEDNERVQVSTDLLSFSVPKRRFRVLGHLTLRGKAVIGPTEESDLVVYDQHGERYCASLDPDFQVEVEERGSLRSTIKVSGSYVSASGRKFLDYCLRLHVYAHSSALKIEHTFINREKPEEGVKVGAIALELSLNLEKDSHRLVHHDALEQGHGYHTVARYVAVPENVNITARTMRSAHLENPASVGWDPAKAPLQVRTLLPPGRVEPWVDVADGSVGLMTGFHRMVENFPKGLASEGNRITYHIWPSWAGELSLPQGMAKTHQLLLLFHPAGAEPQELEREFADLAGPLRPVIPCQWYQRCQVNDMENVLTYQPAKYPRFELLLRTLFNKHVAFGTQEASKWWPDGWPKGMLNYGDDINLEYHTLYNSLGFGPPGDVWTNNEYDLIHAAVTQYCRTGAPEVFHAAEISAQHQIDVDQIHYSDDPLRLGGMPHHSQFHVTGTVFPSHLFAQGLVGFYCLTGNRAILEGAVAVGECLLRWIDSNWQMVTHDSREAGWPLLALSSLYEVTGQERFREGARKIMDYYHSVSDGGRFYGSPVTEGVGFGLVIALMGIKYYHRVTGDQRAAKLLIDIVDYRLKYHIIPEGISLGKMDVPFMFLETLAYVYELTGDEKYARAGLRELEFYLDRNMDLIERSQKPIALCYRSLVYFLKAADQIGELKALDYRN